MALYIVANRHLHFVEIYSTLRVEYPSVPQRQRIASYFLKTGEEGLSETLVYPFAKLHGIIYQNTVIFNNQKHFWPTSVCGQCGWSGINGPESMA